MQMDVSFEPSPGSAPGRPSLRVAAPRRSRSATTPRESPDLPLELVGVIGDPDHRLVECVRRLPYGDESAEDDARPAPRDEGAARGDLALPGGIWLEDGRELRHKGGGRANGGQTPVPVPLLELLGVARLE